MFDTQHVVSLSSFLFPSTCYRCQIERQRLSKPQRQKLTQSIGKQLHQSVVFRTTRTVNRFAVGEKGKTDDKYLLQVFCRLIYLNLTAGETNILSSAARCKVRRSCFPWISSASFLRSVATVLAVYLHAIPAYVICGSKLGRLLLAYTTPVTDLDAEYTRKLENMRICSMQFLTMGSVWLAADTTFIRSEFFK